MPFPGVSYLSSHCRFRQQPCRGLNLISSKCSNVPNILAGLPTCGGEPPQHLCSLPGMGHQLFVASLLHHRLFVELNAVG